jgi:hypothetical protein
MTQTASHRKSWIFGGWRALLLALALTAPARLLAAGTEDLTITVTPVAEVSLDLSATTYAFGPIDVNTSTHTATPLTLTNHGGVTVTVDKQIQAQSDPSGWVAATTPGADQYVLYVATAAARPALGDFSAATQFGAQGVVSPLTGTTGVQPTLPPTGAGQSVDLWFRLDMPSTVSTLTPRTITVRFTATAQ